MFVHGFASDASTWNVTAPALHHDLMLAPVQPTLHWYHTEENQAIELLNILNVDPIAGSAASLPFVAHSNGGVVSREYARTAGSRINGLVSVPSPHMGAPIAVNWMNGAVLQYGHDLALAVLDPVSFYDQNDWHALPIWLYNYSGAIVNFMYNLAGLLCGQNIGFCIDQATNQVIPMVPQVANTNGYIDGLNAGGNLAHEDAVLANRRVGLWTDFPPVNAIFYMLQPRSAQSWVRARETAMLLYQMEYDYYNDSDDWFLQQNAYRWLDGEAAMFDIDAAWAALNGSLDAYYRVVDGDGFIYGYMVVEPCDAFLPSYAVQFPHAQRNEFVGNNIAHTMQTSSVDVRNRLENALSQDLGIPRRPAGSVARVGISPNPASVVVGGATAHRYRLRHRQQWAER